VRQVVVAVKVPVTADASSFLATYDLCGYRHGSGAGWKCKTNVPATNNTPSWTSADYDDSDWRPAHLTERFAACQDLGSDCNLVATYDSHGIWAETCPGGSKPVSGNLFCRLVLPQKCDRTCNAGAKDLTDSRCHDREHAMGFATMNAPALYWVYVDGQLVGGDQSLKGESKRLAFPIKPDMPTVTVAVRACLPVCVSRRGGHAP
jgi:hypothetical protein